MIKGFKGPGLAPIKGCHTLKEEDIFENLFLPDNKKIPKEMIIEADTSIGLSQAIGYLKYNLAKIDYNIVLRGQRRLYGSLKASLFRNANSLSEFKTSEGSFKNRISLAQRRFARISLKGFLNSKGVLSPLQKDLYNFIDIERDSFPPLLQHYGINTPWLDVVDNIWVALWFSCWEREKRFQIPSTKYIYPDELNREVARYSVYHERREISGLVSFSKEIKQLHRDIHSLERKKMYFMTNNKIPEQVKRNKLRKTEDNIIQKTKVLEKLKQTPSYCYIILLRIPSEKDMMIKEKIKYIDLRKSIPSYYLRPHAQHALAIRRMPGDDQDLSSFIEGIIRVRLEYALQWLGMGQTLSVHNLFPSPCFDNGLRKLLGLKVFNHEIEIPTP